MPEDPIEGVSWESSWESSPSSLCPVLDSGEAPQRWPPAEQAHSAMEPPCHPGGERACCGRGLRGGATRNNKESGQSLLREKSPWRSGLGRAEPVPEGGPWGVASSAGAWPGLTLLRRSRVCVRAKQGIRLWKHTWQGEAPQPSRPAERLPHSSASSRLSEAGSHSQIV